MTRFTADDFRSAAANVRSNPKMAAMLVQAAESIERLAALERELADGAYVCEHAGTPYACPRIELNRPKGNR
jgi:hypothetical protein